MDSFDLCIIGAGVSGLAVARQLCLDPRFKDKSLEIGRAHV